ncbi:Serine/threonine-protein phosphatase 4 regulatory subunit 4 [Varanus komodoensis]|nr:Serine/threonine-protein phosphatase 4 regulatory subunit 4 [Varanus komodoensis]
MGVPDHLLYLLKNLYVGQEATVRTGHGTTDWFKIGKGVIHFLLFLMGTIDSDFKQFRVQMVSWNKLRIFTPEQHLRFLEFYKKLCTLGLEQENGHNDNQVQLQTLEQEKKYISVRKNCAYNLPAMMMFVDPKNFNLELYSTFFCLCHDPEVPVRHTMAIGFYEVAKLLNTDVYVIHKELVALLQDESLEVLDALIGHLPEILELLSTGGENNGSESKLLNFPELIPALTRAEQRAATSLKWRTHEKLLQKYACLPHVISSDQIYYRFLHRMLTIIMTNNVLPVQKAAARTLCVYLRYNRKQEQRHEVIQKLIELKSTLKVPTDKHLLQQLELSVRKLLCEEKDKDVLNIVKKMVLELDRMETSLDAFQKRFYENDLLDQQKEREEHLLLEMEQLEKEKQQNEGRSTTMSDKMYEKKRRDSKTSSTLAKTISMSVSGNPSGASTSKEVKKSKLVRSQSFSSQALHSKYGNLEKCPSKSSSTGYTSVSAAGKSSMFSFTDDSFRTRSSNSSGTAAFSSTSTLSSSSRNASNSVDQKNNGSKESHSRKDLDEPGLAPHEKAPPDGILRRQWKQKRISFLPPSPPQHRPDNGFLSKQTVPGGTVLVKSQDKNKWSTPENL